MSDSGNLIEWEVISTSTRKQALQDDPLIDVTSYRNKKKPELPEITRKFGFFWNYL